MTNTINNVPRELLERASNLAFQTQHYPLHEELRTLLSAQSPAGVDGLNRYEVFPYLDDDVAELDICEADDGSFVKYDAAAAIIDGLRGDIAELDDLRERQSRLLSQSAVALRGPEPALTRYSHADIPSRVKVVIDERDHLAQCLKFARTTMAVVANNANLRGVEYRSLIAEIKRIDAKLASLK